MSSIVEINTIPSAERLFNLRVSQQAVEVHLSVGSAFAAKTQDVETSQGYLQLGAAASFGCISNPSARPRLHFRL
jgi:hypothetical protein